VISSDEIHKVLEGYDKKKLTIATIGSHTALQILKGAKDEGFRTLVICRPGKEDFYGRFGIADEILSVKEYIDILDDKFQQELIEKNVILIPHGSFVEYVGAKNIEDKLRVPVFGNRTVLGWESDRSKEREWLRKAGIKMPREFDRPEDIDCLSIVKFPGARGGRNYFLANNAKEFNENIKGMNLEDKENFTIQEYIIGTRFYPHYFYSPLKDRVELLGIDIRYETNVDGVARISHLLGEHPNPSFVVAGNIPVVARESLLPRLMDIAENLVKASKNLFKPGMVGPFCIESICTEELKFIVFEISARIVAGTNLYMQGSPYSQLLYKEPMSTGRRIAREMKEASKGDLTRIVL